MDQGSQDRIHRDRTWRFLRALGCDPAEAEDLAQDAYVRLLHHPEVRAETHDLTRWLVAVARNLLIDQRRRQQRIVSVSFTHEVEAELVRSWRQGSGSSFADAAQSCLGELAPRAALILQRFYGEGRSRIAIAQELDMTEAGVKTALQRARAILRVCIERKTLCQTNETTCSTRS